MSGRVARMPAVGWKDRIAATAERATELARDAADSAPAKKVRESAPVQSITDSYAGLKRAAHRRRAARVRHRARAAAARRDGALRRRREAMTDQATSRRPPSAASSAPGARRCSRDRPSAPPTRSSTSTARRRRSSTSTCSRPRPDRRADRRPHARAVEHRAGRHRGGGRDPRDRPVGVRAAEPAPRRAGRVAHARRENRGPPSSRRSGTRAVQPDDVREKVMGKRNITGTMFAGKRVKEFIARAEAALGVLTPDLNRRAAKRSARTRVSLPPPCCDELTTSVPASSATRVSPPGSSADDAVAAERERAQVDVARLEPAVDDRRMARERDDRLRDEVRGVGLDVARRAARGRASRRARR